MVTREDQQDTLSWQDVQQHLLWWLRKGYSILSFLFKLIRRRPVLCLSAMVLFGLLFTGSLYLQSREYLVSTTFVYGDLHPKVFGDMVGKLNNLIINGDYGKVASLMHLSPPEAEKIKGVDVSDIKGRPLSTNFTMQKEPMQITLRLSGPMPEDTLYKAVAYYLNSNPFTASRLELRKRLLLEELDYINRRLPVIDSLLASFYSRRQASGSSSSNITIESAEGKTSYELLTFSRELLKRKGEVENLLINPENVFAIDNFLILPRVQLSAGNLLLRLLAGALAGYLLAALITLWQEQLRKMVE